MKRNVESVSGSPVKAPEAPRSEMRLFGNDMEYMVEQMGRLFKNQVIGYMNASTIGKFEDEQSGNFASIFLKQAGRVNKKLVKRFDEKRIKTLTDKYTNRIDARNQQSLYSRLEKSVGISSQELEATEGLSATINAYKLETFQWVKKMRDDTLQEWTSNTLRSMAEGESLESILAQFDGMIEKRKGHAKMVARTQITTFNSLTTKARAKNLGISKAVWVTSADERVRPSHEARNGKEFTLSDGLYSSVDGKTLLPGVDYQCRCDYRLIIPKMGEG